MNVISGGKQSTKDSVFQILTQSSTENLRGKQTFLYY